MVETITWILSRKIEAITDILDNKSRPSHNQAFVKMGEDLKKYFWTNIANAPVLLTE